MAGRVFRILQRTEFVFSKLQGSQSQSVTIVRDVDISWARELTASVRIHPGSNLGTGINVVLQAYADFPTNEDPATPYVGNNAIQGALTPLAVSPNLGGFGAGAVGPAGFLWQIVPTTGATSLGPYLTFAVSCTQPAAPVACDFWMSIDGCGKE